MDSAILIFLSLILLLILLIIVIIFVKRASSQPSPQPSCTWGLCIDGSTCKANPWGSNCSRPMRVESHPCRRSSYYTRENRPHTCSSDCDCDGRRYCSPWGYCQGRAR